MENSELLQRLLATFRVEAEERLDAITGALLQLEEQPAEQKKEILEGVFREAHSLKGAARAVNLTTTEAVCQALEGVLAALKSGALELTEELIELLQRTVDLLGNMLEPVAASAVESDGLLGRLNRAAAGLAPEPGGSPFRRPRPTGAEMANAASDDGNHETTVAGSAPVPTGSSTREAIPAHLDPLARRASAGTVRIPLPKLEAIVRHAENLVPSGLAAIELAGELRRTAELLQAERKRRAQLQSSVLQIRRGTARAGESSALTQVLDYLESNQHILRDLEARGRQLFRRAELDQRHLTGLITGLQASARELHLMPASSLLEMYPRLARELAREQGKEVRLLVEGGEIEVDRRVLEELKDPLTHLVRNAVDHGIETPEARRARHKPERGRITIAVEQRDSNRIEVRVSDDGNGVDLERLRGAAAAIGTSERVAVDELDGPELLELVFISGLSTSPMITDISGRGLGLSIVREKVELLGGRVETKSEAGKGMSFRLTLPLTLATFHGLLIASGDRSYVLPSRNIEQALLFRDEDVATVESRDTIVVRGQALALVRLEEILGLPRSEAPGSGRHRKAIVFASGARIAFEVDEILGGQEVLIKPLGFQLVRVPNLQGATILGNGEVVPVLNVPDLIHTALQSRRPQKTVSDVAEAVPPRSILVVEDSITSRSLLKGILESAGYQVRTAVDGLDAFATLKSAPIDLVVSDVDMPRLNGLDLTARVRDDHELSELPVILVTSMSSPADRERGVDVGANAYIVKSEFDQSSLLDAVRRLIG